jgi:hypothetical protein
MRPTTVALVSVLACSTALAVSAQTAPAAGAERAAATESSETIGDEVTTMKCVDLFELYSAAAPGAGKNAEDLAQAQDDVLSFVLWVHGYLNGRDGIDLVKRPLNKAGIEKLVTEMADVCRPNPEALFLEAVKGIR